MMTNDWTYDRFYADMQKYNATPIKGVHCRANATFEERFITWFKNNARDFKANWVAKHGNRLYDKYDGYIGDAFARELDDMCFSDFYKDVYNQRPHLADWFYVTLLGFPTQEDIARKWCAHPIENAIEYAEQHREWLMARG